MEHKKNTEEFNEVLVERKGYGDPVYLHCLVSRFREWWGLTLKATPGKSIRNDKERAHDECIGMTFLKIGRIATGEFNEDNYDDAIGYLTLAKNILKGEKDVTKR